MNTISTDEAEGIVYGPHVAMQELSKHRWYTRYLVVFGSGDEGYQAFYYDEPATEIQEDMDRFEDDPVPVYSVQPRVVSTTIYEVEDD